MKSKNIYTSTSVLRKFGLLLVIAYGLMLTACNKEEAITPDNINEYGYHVPQGNNSYDQRIVNYYNRWGTYILYKFTQQDILWKVTSNDISYKSVPADSNYVSNLLDVLDSTFFRYYSDTTLQRCLPTKFFLCSSLTYSNTQVDAYLCSPVANTATGGYQSFAVNWGSNRILHMKNGTQDSSIIFRGNINYGFLKLLDLLGKTTKTVSFTGITDYVTPLPSTATNADRYKRGFLGLTSGYSSVSSNQTDWYNYIQTIVNNPYSFLTDKNTTATDATGRGILSSVKDSTGLVTRKYNAIVNFYKASYNIDLQRIGNGAQ